VAGADRDRHPGRRVAEGNHLRGGEVDGLGERRAERVPGRQVREPGDVGLVRRGGELGEQVGDSALNPLRPEGRDVNDDPGTQRFDSPVVVGPAPRLVGGRDHQLTAVVEQGDDVGIVVLERPPDLRDEEQPRDGPRRAAEALRGSTPQDGPVPEPSRPLSIRGLGRRYDEITHG
jgi:hypothetical protein